MPRGGIKPHLTLSDTAMTGEEVDRLLNWLKEKVKNGEAGYQTVYDICSFILNTGFRCSEVVKLTKEDIIWDDKPHILITGKARKSKKVGNETVEIRKENRAKDQVFIPPGYVGSLKELYRNAKKYMFTKKGGRLTRIWIWRWVKRAMLGANLNPRYSVHTLRHRFCLKVQLATGDLNITRFAARHKDISTTQRYVNMLAMMAKIKEGLDNFEVDK